MPSKTEKQRKFFGAVMGAKKGQKGSSGEAKKVAKEMPKKEIKKFLKKEEDEQYASGEKSEIKKKHLDDLRKKNNNFDPNKIKKIDWKEDGDSLSDKIKKGLEEDEQSVVKQMKKSGGKIAFEGPNVKERKHFAPPTQTHKAKKGKGSYDRKSDKNLFESNTIKDGQDRWFRKPKTKGEKKKASDAKEQGIKVRSKRNEKNLPDDWDDKNVSTAGKKTNKMKKPKRDSIRKSMNESNSILKFLEAIMTNDHKHLKDSINQKIQKRISAEIDTPLF